MISLTDITFVLIAIVCMVVVLTKLLLVRLPISLSFFFRSKMSHIICFAQTNRTLLKHNKYLLVFLSVFVWVYGWAGFTGLYFRIHRDELRQGFVDYVLCNAAKEEHCVNEHPIPMWVVYVEVINFCNMGTILFFTFGIQPKVMRHWKNMLTLLWRGEFRALTDLSIQTKSRRTSIKVTGYSKDKNLRATTMSHTSHTSHTNTTSDSR